MPTYKFDLDVLNKMLGTYLDIVNLAGGGIGLSPGIKLIFDKDDDPGGKVSDHYDGPNSRRVITVGSNDQLHIYDGSIDFLSGVHKKIKSAGGSAGVATVYVGLAADGAYTSIAAALAALPAAGGRVYILPGYTETITSTITIPASNIAIICPTCDAVITDGSADGMVMISLNSADWGVISGIKFAGKGSGKTTTAIATGASTSERWLITRCWFHDCYTSISITRAHHWIVEQCYFTGYANQAIRMNQYPYYCVVRDCYALNGTFTNFIYTDHTGGWNSVERCAVVNCGAGCTAFYARERSRYAATRFSHCYSYRNGTGFYIAPPYSDTYAPVWLVACLALQNYSHGFLLHGVYCRAICTDCVAIDNSYTNPNTASGFYIGSSRRVILQNCHGYKQARAEQKYGFEVAASSQKAEIRGGRWYPNQTASWLDNGTDTIIDARDD